MTETATSLGFRRESFDAFLESREEPDWLRELRMQAWSRFEAMPLPSQRDEEWMRTDIRLFHLDKFGFPPEPSAAAAPPEGLLNWAGRPRRSTAIRTRQACATSGPAGECCSAASTSWPRNTRTW
jgi:hypothetical protein